MLSVTVVKYLDLCKLMAQVVVDAHGEEGERLLGYLCALLLGLCMAYNDDSVEQFKKYVDVMSHCHYHHHHHHHHH